MVLAALCPFQTAEKYNGIYHPVYQQEDGSDQVGAPSELLWFWRAEMILVLKIDFLHLNAQVRKEIIFHFTVLQRPFTD